MMGDTLVALDWDLKTVHPLLAKSWTISDDRLTYTFNLRRGVRFHNDEPFDAQVVKFSYERAVAKDSTNKDRAVFANIASIDTPDPHTAIFKYERPMPQGLLLRAPRYIDWRVDAAILHFYGELKFLEEDLSRNPNPDPARLRALARRLVVLEQQVDKMELPDRYADRWYTLREHLQQARTRALAAPPA